MNIAYLITGLGSGGAEGMLVRVLRELSRRDGVSVAVYVLRPVDFHKAEIEALGIPVIFLNIGFNLQCIPNLFRFFLFLNHTKPILHTWLYHADLIGGFLGRLAGVKTIIWSIRQSNISIGFNKFSLYLVIRICGFLARTVPTHIISCSEAGTASHLKVGYPSARIELIPNGFEVNRFTRCFEMRLVNSPKGPRPIICHVGRRDPQKNQSGFVEVATQLRGLGVDCEYWMIGAGVDGSYAELIEQIEEVGMRNSIRLLGERRDLYSLLSDVACLVSTSYGEGFPNVIAEALLCGVPVVGTDVGESATLIGETGTVVKTGDYSGLAQGIVEILTLSHDDRLHLGREGHDRVSSQFGIQVVTDRFVEVYMRKSHSQ